MTHPPLFLTVDHVLAVHARMIDEFGGDSGVRDKALLESAVAMPPARFEGKFLHRMISEMAGAYLFHLCRNHPFVDGNKRTALAAAEIFLNLNRRTLSATNAQLEKLTTAVAESSLTKQQTLQFFKKHT